MRFGYTRVSRKGQNIERQIRNIKNLHPDAVIIQEVHTRTTLDRKEWQKLMKIIKPSDIIIFDSVSRLSGNAEEGFAEYERLYNMGVVLVFLKEPHINTETYKKALQNNIQLTGNNNVDFILEGVNKYLMALAKEQIRLAFEQSEKEISDLHQRTKEGLVTAKLAGKQIGRKPGTTVVTKKAIAAKEMIKKHSKHFGGSLSNEETIQLLRISRNSFYKYIKELKIELEGGNI